MDYFANNADRNFLIDSFFDNRKELNIFFEHFSKPYYVFYFDATKDEVENNITTFSAAKDHSIQRKNYSSFVENRADILAFLKGKPYFHTIKPAGLALRELENSIVSALAPKIYVAKPQNNALFQEYVALLEKDRDFQHLPVNTLIEREIQRGTELGKRLKEQKGHISSSLKCELIQKIIFRRPQAKKFLLTDFPETIPDFEEFEHEVCRVDYLISFLKEGEKIASSNELSPQTYFFSQGRHLIITQPRLEILDLYISRRNNYGFVIGPPGCGKTSVAKHIGSKFDQIVIEWEPLIEELKKKLGKHK
jgi:adenylate kinase family enzyme